MARDVHGSANSRWSRLLRLQDNGFNGAGMAYYTWKLDGVASRNYASVDPATWSSVGTPLPPPVKAEAPTCVAHCRGSVSNYPSTFRWSTNSHGNGSALVVLEEQLRTAPRLANTTLYAAVEVQALSGQTGFAIWLDSGDGTWQQSLSEALPVNGPRTLSYQISTGGSGVVRVALGLFPVSKGSPSSATSLSVELLGPVVVSVVGAPYDELYGY